MTTETQSCSESASWRHHRLLIGIPLILTFIIGMFATLRPHVAYAADTTYYIDNSGSPACNDANSGTDVNAPWCDFSPVNATSMTLQSGDRVLLKSGDTWNQGLAPHGSGTGVDAQITIGCYGATCNSNYPVINPNSSSTDAIYLENPSFWTVTNLTLTGAYDGVEANFNTLNHQGLTLQNIYILNVQRMGIDIDGFNGTPHYQVPAGQYIISNITIGNVTTVNGQNGLGFMADSSPWAGQQLYTDPCCNFAQQNIVVKNFTATGSSSCAVWLGNLSHLTMMDSDVYGNTGCGTTMYNVQQNDVTFVNGVYDTTAKGSIYDNSAFNEDNNLTHVHWRGNYFQGNYGSALEWTETDCFTSCTTTTDTDAEISSNAFSGNSSGNDSGFYGDIDSTYAPFATGSVQNNLYYDTPQTSNTFCHNCTYFTQTNNTSISAGSDLFNAGEQFSSTQGKNQWSYKYWNGSSWVDMSYDSTSGRWNSASGAWISQFDETPDNCNGCLTARWWTAPKSGNISIRGWVLKNSTGGNGVNVAIVKNATWLLPTGGYPGSPLGANDQIGFATSVDTTVNQGDVIIFLVDGGSSDNSHDIVSWAPSIGYTSGN